MSSFQAGTRLPFLSMADQETHENTGDQGMLEVRPLRLELGCGQSKRHAGSVGIDILNLAEVDIVGDALTVLRGLPDASVASIYSEHFLEHVEDPLSIVREAARVLERGGEFRALMPHFSNPAFYSDPTHRAFFGLYTFAYWVRSSPFKRQVPHYIDPLPFALISATHVFKSSPPFYIRHALKKTLSCWVNGSGWTQEFYEEHLCWLMPCYELDFILRRD